MNMDLEQNAIMRLREAADTSERFYKAPLIVTTSGGKDSSVCVALAEKAGIDFEVMHNHTTVDAPETVYFIRREFKRLEEKGVKCTVNYPRYKGERVTMWSLIPQKLMPPTRLVRYCCSILKERGGQGRYITTGVRWAESAARKKNRGIFENGHSNPEKRVILNNDNDDRRRLFETCMRQHKAVCNPKRVYLSPSNQTANTYSYGNTTEAVQCGRIAEYCRKALLRSGVEVMVGQYDTMANRCAASDKFNANLHVPIHTNGCNGVASGTRIFCFSSDKDSAGYKAAKAVFDVLAPFTPGESENIKEYPGLFEVRTPKAPTVYIEVDFHDVPAVAKWIIENAEGIGEKIAEGLCDALDVAYKEPDTNSADIPADEDTGTETTGKTLYRVQVGAFSVKENAESFLQEVKALGLSNAFITEVKV